MKTPQEVAPLLGADGAARLVDLRLDLLGEGAATPPLLANQLVRAQRLDELIEGCAWEHVVAALREDHVPMESQAERALLLDLLERRGTADEVDLAVQACSGLPEAGRPEMVAKLQEALTPLLKREPEAVGDLRRHLVLADADVTLAIARAAAACGSPSTCDVLLETLGRKPELDLPLIGLITRAADDLVEPCRNTGLSRLRAHILGPEYQLRREAAQACGRLVDFDAFDSLLEMLGEDNPTLRETAHRALQHLTGLNLGPDPSHWTLWIDSERAWFEGESRAALATLEQREPRCVVAGLNTLRQHRYRRLELAESVAALLDHPAPSVSELACSVVRDLAPEFVHRDHPGCAQAGSSSDAPSDGGAAVAAAESR